MIRLAFYISGHGLGHLSRETEVVKAILAEHPDAKIHIRTKAHPWFIEDGLGATVQYEPVQCDTGVRQVDSLHLLKRESLEDYNAFYQQREVFYKAELKFLKKYQITGIVTDFSPFAIALGKKANLPAIGIANFTWDWILAPYAEEYPEYRWIPTTIQEMQSTASLILKLPFSHNFIGFDRVVSINMITRLSEKPISLIQEKLEVPVGKKVILLSFGGFSIDQFSSNWLEQQEDYLFIANETSALKVPGLADLSRKTLQLANLQYIDLVNGADLVITKPGYGIVSDCIGNHTGMIYTSRGEFREYDILASAIHKYLDGVFIDPVKLQNGELQETLKQYMSMEGKKISLPTNGAAQAAEWILRII